MSSAVPKLRIWKPPPLKLRRNNVQVRDRAKFCVGHKPYLLALAKARNGLTDYELQGLTNSTPSHTRGRRNELVQMRLVEDSEQERKFPSGRKGVVWVLTEAGREKVQELRKGGKK